VWSKVLGVQVTRDAQIGQQVDFFVDNLEVITRLVQADPEIEAKLRDINWVAVKDRLNLSPEANRDDPGSWLD
jgi:hypothetical protein